MRNARPTDIVALVAFDGRVYPNEAHPWDQLGRDAEGPHALGSAFEQWFSFATGHATWVSVQGQTVRGVIAARRRAARRVTTRAAWEIDTLIAAADDVGGVALTLFDQAVRGAVRAGAHKLFLRLEAGSDLLTAAHQAGFASYARETLLRLNPPRPSAAAEQPRLALRPHDKGDAHFLYQLYRKATPQEVQRYEAATFQEWLTSQEERSHGRGRLNLVGEHSSRAMAWLRASRDAGLGRLDLLVHPDAWPETDAVLATGLAALRAEHPVYCLVREYAQPVRERLQSVGFVPAGEYVCLAKRLALPVRELRPRRVPVPALVKPLIPKPLVPALSGTEPPRRLSPPRRQG